MHSAEGVSLLYYVERMFEAHGRAIDAAKEASDLRINPVCETVKELKTCADKASGRSSISVVISILALLASIILHFAGK